MSNKRFTIPDVADSSAQYFSAKEDSWGYDLPKENNPYMGSLAGKPNYYKTLSEYYRDEYIKENGLKLNTRFDFMDVNGTSLIYKRDVPKNISEDFWVDTTQAKPKNSEIMCVILLKQDIISPATKLFCWKDSRWVPADGFYMEEIENRETGEVELIHLWIEDEIVFAWLPIYPRPE